VYLLLHLPILILVVFSLNASRYSVSWTGFTLDWYRRLAERGDLLLGLERSLLVGAISTVVATVFGTLLAVALARRRFRGRRALEGLLYLPIVTPEIVAGTSLLVLFVAVGAPLGIVTISIAHIAFNIGFVAVIVRARLEGMDQSLEEAALVLGRHLGGDRLSFRPGQVAREERQLLRPGERVVEDRHRGGADDREFLLLEGVEPAYRQLHQNAVCESENGQRRVGDAALDVRGTHTANGLRQSIAEQRQHQ